MSFVHRNRYMGWDHPLHIPEDLRAEVKTLNTLTAQWKGRPFTQQVAVRTLHSDSSDRAWAGVDIHSGEVVQEFWREKDGLHINIKELAAAINTIKSRAKPEELVHLCMDNSVTFWHLKKGGQAAPFKCPDERILDLVPGKRNFSLSPVSSFSRGPGRQLVQTKSGQGGLHPGQESVSKVAKSTVTPYKPPAGPFCKPRKPPAGQVCFQRPPLASMGGGCLGVLTGGGDRRVCKPPLDSHRPLVGQIKDKSPAEMHGDHTNVGFSVLVAPTNENASAWNSSHNNTPLSGDVLKLFWRANASSQMAPSLHSFARKLLEAKQMQPEEVDLFLKSLGII